MSFRLERIRGRLASSFPLRLTIVVSWITVVMLGLYVGLGVPGGWAHLLTTALTIPLVLYFELVLARTDTHSATTSAGTNHAPQSEGFHARIRRGRTATRLYRRLWLVEGLLALGAGALAAWAPDVADRFVEFARHFPGLAPLADGLATLDPEAERRRVVVLYLAVWWGTLPIKTVCAYLEDIGLRLEIGTATTPVTVRSVLYTMIGTPLAWIVPAVVFSTLGHKLAAGEIDLADPLSLEFAFLVGPLVNGSLIAWAVWSFYGFVIALLSVRFVEIADLARLRIGAKLPGVLAKRHPPSGDPDA